jgi:hypothetical protein
MWRLSRTFCKIKSRGSDAHSLFASSSRANRTRRFFFKWVPGQCFPSLHSYVPFMVYSINHRSSFVMMTGWILSVSCPGYLSPPCGLNTSLSLCHFCSSTKLVLRKKPPGTILNPSAHNVQREYRILSALGQCPSIPVPKTFLLCEDEKIIGTPFYVRRAIFPAVVMFRSGSQRTIVEGDGVSQWKNLHRRSIAVRGTFRKKTMVNDHFA